MLQPLFCLGKINTTFWTAKKVTKKAFISGRVENSQALKMSLSPNTAHCCNAIT